jgi:hypothetical protein
MSLAFIITVESPLSKEPPALKGASGKSLAREADRLDFAARKCKVASLTHFLSESQSALIEQMKADGFDPSKMRIPPEQWFAPAEVLVSVRALISHVGANLNDFKQPNPILRDLKSVEAQLISADGEQKKVHFSRADV